MFPKEIDALLWEMEKQGVLGYVVGGAVRDIIMGRTPSDYDIAAQCEPKRLLEIFKDYRTVDVGIRFGTLSVETPVGFCEITCCRKEGGYEDMRRPDRVEYTCDIISDLARRDFTVNAMAMGRGGELIDPFFGREDIRRGIIRAVGDPRERFLEDALRMLRALRFSAALGFEIEGETDLALRESFPLVRNVSGERSFAELKKLLCEDGIYRVLTEYSREICTLIPELLPTVGFSQNNPHHIYTVYEHIAHSVKACKKDPVLRLVMLLHDIAKPLTYTVDENGIGHFFGHPELSCHMAKKVLSRFKADKKTAERVCFLIKHHDVRPAATRKSIRKYLKKVGFDGARDLLFIRRADLRAQSPEFFHLFDYLDENERIIDELWREGACVSIDGLAVGGRELLELGAEKGPFVGELLERMLDKVVSEEIENEREALLAFASRELKRQNKR